MSEITKCNSDVAKTNIMSEMTKILLTVVTIMVISDGDDLEILNSFVAAVTMCAAEWQKIQKQTQIQIMIGTRQKS